MQLWIICGLEILLQIMNSSCGQGVQSVNAGPLPANILPLVARHVYNQENTLTAALTCDRTLGLTTFMNDPQVTLNWNQGKELFDTMLHNTRAYLPKEWNA